MSGHYGGPPYFRKNNATFHCEHKILKGDNLNMVDFIEWSDLGLKRLFNPNNSEFLPIEEQLKLYKQRDLSKTKYYKTVIKIWGNSKPRKRLIVAPKMERVEGVDIQVKSPPVRLQPIEGQKGREWSKEDWVLSEAEKLKLHDEELAEKRETFKTWYDEQRQLRESLDSLGVSESWLARKSDRTPLEEKLYRKMVEERLPKTETVQSRLEDKSREDAAFLSRLTSRSGRSTMSIRHVEKSRSPTPVRVDSPVILTPPPEALAIIVKHLNNKRMRLIDLFTRADKDKNWMITKEEFQNCIKDAKIPLADDLLEELVHSLDHDMNDQLDYRELARGIKEYQREERRYRKARMRVKSETNSSKSKDLDKQGSSRSSPHTKSRSSPSRPSSKATDKRVKSAASEHSHISFAVSEVSTVSLEVPKVDITEQVHIAPDTMIMKRKKEKVFNKQAQMTSAGKKRSKSGNKGKVKTGNRAVDNHALASTLSGETAEGIDRYREARLKEYHKLLQMCEERSIPLTQQLLERALLSPGDKNISRIGKKITQPGSSVLVSSHFADPPARPRTPIEVKHADKVHRSRTGELLMEAKHTYPQRRYIEPQKSVMNLSTGKAFVAPKIDSWLTFEEYDELTRHLQKRYVVLDGKADKQSVRAGHMLNKIRLCMDDMDSAVGVATVYQSTHQKKPSNLGYNNNLRTWPTDSGYIQFADITQQKRYTIDPK
ncbi:EF-hand calcium-binding domain-containing protein 12-like isoform X2 [Ptychodera flava]|uniref:EF-hand calcium-binding domain-containing protein 12-like isoform X2 n=1 Tax=Ptychodera flava TaxID=63121 RepID=UPI00396A6089